MTDTTLPAIRALLIEDESLLLMLLEEVLPDMGYAVAGSAHSLEDARSKIDSVDFDVALVDVNLAGVESFPVVESLVARGIPVMFVTGYGASVIPDHLRHVPVLAKPFGRRELEAALRRLPLAAH